MSRAGFTTANYLSYASGGMTHPHSVSCWVYVGNLTNFGVVWGTSQNASGPEFDRILFNSSEQATLQSKGVTTLDTLTYSSALTIGTWVHIYAFFAVADRQIYINGVAGASSVTNVGAKAAQTYMTIGAFRYQAASVLYGLNNFRVQDVAIWSRSTRLPTDSIAALAGGASPLLISPGQLVHYWRCRGVDGEPDIIGARPMTETGTVTSTESRLISLDNVIYPNFTPAVGGSFQAAWARNATTTIGGGITA